MIIRQPIVSVLGHVDHGKTTILDAIRGTVVAKREAGGITQHIGATEVPLDTINDICKDLLGDKKFAIPGLLFIDTPGHHSFTTLRARGGALADLAILVIDINEGLMPQTIESINILQRYKTPFVIACNKIDRINGWVPKEAACFKDSVAAQDPVVQQVLDEKFYKVVGQIYDLGMQCDRYDKIEDFTSEIALIPISAKYAEGISEMLMVLVGLAQRYLEENLLTDETTPARGTVLEVKEEKGLGATIDTIIYSGTISQGDQIVVGTGADPIVTKVKALFKPKPLDEIRDPKERFASVKEVSAAAGIKISAPNLDNAVSGASLQVVEGDLEKVCGSIQGESQLNVSCEECGIIIKADAIGSIEALAFEMKHSEIPIEKAEVGDISRRDIVSADTIVDPLRRVILGFNVKVLPDAEEEIISRGVKVIQSNIIYKLLEDYEEWYKKEKEALERSSRTMLIYPGKMLVLPDCVFRVSKPAIVGVRVLAGRIRVGQRLLTHSGRSLGKIASIRCGEENFREVKMGEEVAIALPGITVGRQIKVNDVVYIDLPEGDAKQLRDITLTQDEEEVLAEVTKIKRGDRQFWGM